MPTHTPTPRVTVTGPPGDRHDEILTPEALEFLARLDRAFSRRRRELLTARRDRADRLASGSPLDFPRATSAVRDDPHWRVAPPAPGPADRRVELVTAPTARAAAEALTSGAPVWTADFGETTGAPWADVVGGQLVLLDISALAGERHVPGRGLPSVMVRPRGWHLEEEHLTIDGRPLSASLVDFGLYFFHCAERLVPTGAGPRFSLPELESRYEARLWNDVFLLAQDLLGVPHGSVRATAVIETVTAAFEMEEILYELREHSAGLGADRWGYLFSLVRTFGHRARFLLPDRTDLTPTAPFLRAYDELLVRTCHRRGAHAIGGPTTPPPPGGAAPGTADRSRARAEREHEARIGFDGSSVTDPGLVPLCAKVFDRHLSGRPHQIHRTLDSVRVRAEDLLTLHRTAPAPETERVRADVALALRYFDAWLRGTGTVAPDARPRGIDTVAPDAWLGGTGTVAPDALLVDAAGAELARARLWQWLRQRLVPQERLFGLIATEAAALAAERPDALAAEARELLERSLVARELPALFTGEAPGHRFALRTGVPS
ncbi:malate synthase A [Streptomyces sp. NPDC014861]|uniref:malate synthase n=1 Tax=Streptomyces sp. NPDC014861 TaxID=3364923 RepID=UPI003700389A